MNLLHDLALLEDSDGITDPGGAAPADPAPDPAADPAAVAPDTGGFAPDDPAFIAAVDQRAAEMFEQRLAALTIDQPQQPQQQQGQWDPNEQLNPFGDEFGANLAAYLAQRDQWLLEQYDQRLQPIVQREQQAQAQQAEQLVDQFVTDRWNQQDGELTEPVKTAIRDLAPTYLPEMNARFGATPYAAQQALAKAADTIRAINASSRQAGAAGNAAELAAVAAANGEPATNGAAITMPAKARTPTQLLEQWFNKQ